MSFLHLSLLAGLATVAVPLMIHMLGQRQPKVELFPALRFVRQTVHAQRSSWQLKHWLLLMLRVGLIGSLALALARPRIHSALLSSILTVSTLALLAAFATLVTAIAWVGKRPFSVWGTSGVLALLLWLGAAIWGTLSLIHGPIVPQADRTAPVAVALIIDAGPNMTYRADNQTRLEAAKEMAVWILDQLPVESRVGIFVGMPVSGLSLDPATAKTQVQATIAKGQRMDLLSQLANAMELLAGHALERKEAYIITDLSARAWNSVQTDLRTTLEAKSKEILVQVIDLGANSAVNWSLGDLKIDSQVVPVNSSARIGVEVSRTPGTAGGSVTVRLYREEIDPTLPILSNGQLKVPEAKLVREQSVDLTNEESVWLEFETGSLPSGTNNFQVRIDRPDPLELDNTRFASIVAQPQLPTLIVSQSTDERITRYYSLLIETTGPPEHAGKRHVEQIGFDQLGRIALDQYMAICMIDPPPLVDSLVNKLRERAEKGAGILVVLGRELVGAPPTAAVQGLLPGKLSRINERSTQDRSCYLAPTALTHPAFFLFGSNIAELHWPLYPVFRYWTFDSLADSVQILAKYSDGNSPALTQMKLGLGQVICLTTPLPDFDDTDGDNWNELTIGTDTWLAYAMLSGIVRTLPGGADTKYTFSAGEPVNVNNDPLAWPSQYELFTPTAQSQRIEAVNGSVLLGELEQPGVFRLRGKRTDPVTRSISVNVAHGDTLLVRLTSDELDQMLGVGNYRLARNRDEVHSSVGQARFGQELYSLLMVVVAGLFLAEQAMSNRFYKIKLAGARSSA